MKLYIRLEPPFEWVRVNGIQVDAFAQVSNIAQYPLADEDELIGVVSGEWVTVHKVDLPAKTKRQFQLAVPYALEESISEDIEQLHFICPQWKAGEPNIVYVVAKEKMQQWQGLANEHKLPLDRLVADHSLLPFHDAADYSVCLTDSFDGEQSLLVNNVDGGGVSLDADFIDVWLMDVPMNSTVAVNDKDLTQQLIENNPDRDFRHWPFGSKMAHWLEHTPKATYDLLGDEYRPSVRSFAWRSFTLPAALLMAGVLFVFVYDTYRYLALHSEIRAIEAEQQQILKETFPSLDSIDIGRGQSRSMMAQALKRNTVVRKEVNLQSMLAEIAPVLKAQEITLSGAVYRESVLFITCNLNDFSQVDTLTKTLNARRSIKVELESSASDDGQIVASYTITASK